MSIAALTAVIVGVANGVLITSGGVIGYLKAKSKASIIAGSICGALALTFSLAAFFLNDKLHWFWLADGLFQLLMAAFFAKKIFKAPPTSLDEPLSGNGRAAPSPVIILCTVVSIVAAITAVVAYF